MLPFILAFNLFVQFSFSARLQWTGINLAGLEFAEHTRPGTYMVDYVSPTTVEVDYFMSKGMNIFRLPFTWERLQPTQNGSFNAVYQGRITDFVNYATGKGAKVVIDPHNYARYYDVVIGEGVPTSSFVDFWIKLANLFKSNSNVMFGLMNEPNSMGTETWFASVNPTIAAIRATGATNLILVPGNAWTGAHSWADNWYGTPNGQVLGGNIVDSGNNFAIEVHQYFDSNFGGLGPDCVSGTIGSQKLTGFTNWLRARGYKGFVGEFAGGPNPVCNACVVDFLTFMETNSDVYIGWTWWAGGPWWGNYAFGLDPKSGVDAPQMALIMPFLRGNSPSTPTKAPTVPPTSAPTTKAPTVPPTASPTTRAPTTAAPTFPPPTSSPTPMPTSRAPTTAAPTSPSPTPMPTTVAPIGTPTSTPTTAAPTPPPTTRAPTTSAPTTSAPTPAPTTAAPTPMPTTAVPVGTPTSAPTTSAPTTNAPTTSAPTPMPTTRPPVGTPTSSPTTSAPTRSPNAPTKRPTRAPVGTPTSRPTSPQTSAPTTAEPTSAPTRRTCTDLQDISNEWNAKSSNETATAWNNDPEMAANAVSVDSVSPSSVQNEVLTFDIFVIHDDAELDPSKVTLVCKTVQKDLDTQYNKVSDCFKFRCEMKFGKRASTSTISVNLSPQAPDPFPTWIIAVAVLGALFLVAAIVLILVFIYFNPKGSKGKEGWERY